MERDASVKGYVDYTNFLSCQLNIEQHEKRVSMISCYERI